MRFGVLTLHDLRCHAELRLELGDGCTLLVGGNGVGKTSVLEAMHWLAVGRSFRPAGDDALIRSGADRAQIAAVVHRAADRRSVVGAEIPREGRPRVTVDGRPVARGAAVEELRTTVFTPDDLDLVKGAPQARRSFLDDLLVVLTPRYRSVRDECQRTLRQRNALLRRGLRAREDVVTLGVLTERFAVLGAQLAQGRIRLVGRLLPAVRAAVADLDGGTVDLAVGYECAWSSGTDELDRLAAQLHAGLEVRAERDLERGATSLGPHRDELSLEVDRRDARTHASQGEQRTLALGLRLAAHRLVTETVGTDPVLLLDDVFSELDERRADSLVAQLRGPQTVITSTGPPPGGVRPSATYVMEPGSLSPAA